jgi:hypothetical protein
MTVFIMVAAAAAAIALYNGVVSMAHGGESDRLHSHEHMFMRTGWQALAVLLVFLAMLSAA